MVVMLHWLGSFWGIEACLWLVIGVVAVSILADKGDDDDVG